MTSDAFRMEMGVTELGAFFYIPEISTPYRQSIQDPPPQARILLYEKEMTNASIH
jgi:hypothetical protein